TDEVRVVERVQRTYRDLGDVALRGDELLHEEELEDHRGDEPRDGDRDVTLGTSRPRDGHRGAPVADRDEDRADEREQRRDAGERLGRLRPELLREQHAEREDEATGEEEPDLRQAEVGAPAAAPELPFDES